MNESAVGYQKVQSICEKKLGAPQSGKKCFYFKKRIRGRVTSLINDIFMLRSFLLFTIIGHALHHDLKRALDFRDVVYLRKKQMHFKWMAMEATLKLL